MAGGLKEWGGRLRSWGGAKTSEMKSLKTSQLAPGSPEGRSQQSQIEEGLSANRSKLIIPEPYKWAETDTARTGAGGGEGGRVARRGGV